MAQMGRPRKEIDRDQFEKLCGLLCTEDDIADFFDCSVDTIERFCKREYKTTFADIYKKLCMYGKLSIRRNQFALSKKSPAMAIWLGKQYLGQKEQIEYDNREIIEKLDDVLNGFEDNANRKAE